MTAPPLIRAPRRAGFTLVELMTVMAIITIMLLLVAPAISGLNRSNNLTAAGQMVAGQINLARQIASARNQPVEVRFIQSQPGSALPETVQLGVDDPITAAWTPVSRAARLPQGMAISNNSTLSAFLSGLPTGTMPPGTQLAGTVYQAFYIRPSGEVEPSPSTTTGRSALFLTVVEARTASTAGTPANYVTVQVNPDAGKVLVYRP